MGKASAIISAVVIGIVATVVMGSCNSSGCTDNQSSLPLAGFYSSTTNEPVLLPYIEIYGVGAPNDSILYQSGQGHSIVYLPFRNSSNQVSYVFHYTQQGIDSDEFNDTLTFTYSSEPYFASEQCGAMYCYDISKLDYTCHLIDSVVITDSLVTNTDIERIKIYFRTSSAN